MSDKALPGCAHCGGNNLAITEAQQRIRALLRGIEAGAHTHRGRIAAAQLPAAKERLQVARKQAADHILDAHGGAA